jgi:hypothetical protein
MAQWIQVNMKTHLRKIIRLTVRPSFAHLTQVLEVDYTHSHLLDFRKIPSIYWLIHYIVGVGIELKRRQVAQQTTTMLVQ